MHGSSTNKLPLRWKIGGVIVACLLAIGYVGYRWLTSPERIVRLTFSALDRRDAKTLVALTSERECRELNLTPQSVENCLRETYWRNSLVHPIITIEKSQTRYADILVYSIQVAGVSPDSKAKSFDIEVYQEPSGRWCLALSELLYILPRVINGVEGDHAPVWDAMARRSGIKGVVSPDGSTRYTDGSHTPQIYLTRNY